MGSNHSNLLPLLFQCMCRTDDLTGLANWFQHRRRPEHGPLLPFYDVQCERRARFGCRWNIAELFTALKYCKARRKYTDGVVVHPYCGLTCANLAKGKRPTNGKARGHSRAFSIAHPSSAADLTTKSRGLGRNGCLSCRKAPTNGSVVFCQSCYDEVLSTAPMIFKVPEDHERYKSGES